GRRESGRARGRKSTRRTAARRGRGPKGWRAAFGKIPGRARGRWVLRERLDSGGSCPAGFRICREDSRKIRGFEVCYGAQSVLNHPRDRKKGNTAIEEGRDGEFVSGVVHCRGDSAGRHGLLGQAEHREATFIDRPELEAEQPGKIQRRIHALGPFR